MKSARKVIVLLLMFLVCTASLAGGMTRTCRSSLFGNLASSVEYHHKIYGKYPNSWKDLEAGRAIHPEKMKEAYRVLDAEKRYMFFPGEFKFMTAGKEFKLIVMATDGDFEGMTNESKGRYVIVEDVSGEISTLKIPEIALIRFFKENGLNLMDYTRKGVGGNLPEDFAKTGKSAISGRGSENNSAGDYFQEEDDDLDSGDKYSESEGGLSNWRAMSAIGLSIIVILYVIGRAIMKRENSTPLKRRSR